MKELGKLEWKERHKEENLYKWMLGFGDFLDERVKKEKYSTI
jgi:hypothetical protein